MSLGRWLAELVRRIAALVHRDRIDRDVEEELRLHADLKAEELERQGLPAAESRRLARVRVGATLKLREESRESWGWAWLETFVRHPVWVPHPAHGLRT